MPLGQSGVHGAARSLIVAHGKLSIIYAMEALALLMSGRLLYSLIPLPFQAN